MTTALEDRKFEEFIWRSILQITEKLPAEEDKIKIAFLIDSMKMYLKANKK